MANISLEIRIPNPEDWNAHKRRDAIEEISVLVSERTPSMFMRFLQVLPRNLAVAADAHPIEKMFRLSFPYDGNDLVMLANPVVPSGYVEELLSAPNPVDERVEKGLLFRSVSWVLKKIAGDEAYKEVDKAYKEEVRSDREKQVVLAWDSTALSLLVESLGEWFEANNRHGVRFIAHHPEGSKEIFLDQVFQRSASKKPKA